MGVKPSLISCFGISSYLCPFLVLFFFLVYYSSVSAYGWKLCSRKYRWHLHKFYHVKWCDVFLWDGSESRWWNYGLGPSWWNYEPEVIWEHKVMTLKLLCCCVKTGMPRIFFYFPVWVIVSSWLTAWVASVQWWAVGEPQSSVSSCCSCSCSSRGRLSSRITSGFPGRPFSGKRV